MKLSELVIELNKVYVQLQFALAHVRYSSSKHADNEVTRLLKQQRYIEAAIAAEKGKDNSKNVPLVY